jgi:hypothetical protein
MRKFIGCILIGSALTVVKLMLHHTPISLGYWLKTPLAGANTGFEIIGAHVTDWFIVVIFTFIFVMGISLVFPKPR